MNQTILVHRNVVIISLIAGVVIIFGLSMVIQPCAKWDFNIDAFAGKASGSWEPQPALYCFQGSSEISEEKANEIKNIKTEYYSIKELSELKSEEKIQLENEVRILESQIEKNPSLIPVLVTKKIGVQEIENELGKITFELSTVAVEYRETLDGLNIIAVTNEEKNSKFSQIRVLTGPTVELDQKIYTWTDKVYITIVDPWENTNSDEIETIGNNGELIIQADSGNELKYTLMETGKDTGIFTGEIILTGFPDYDANNDGFADDASGRKSQLGPTEGNLPVNNKDAITVMYKFSENETVIGSSIVNWNIGEIQFLKASYQLNDTAKIRLIDPDLNTNPEAFNFVTIRVNSDTYPDGIDVLLKETNMSTGMFEGFTKFTTGKSGKNLLKTDFGDTIYTSFIDKTLPEPYVIYDELEISATSKIQKTLLPG